MAELTLYKARISMACSSISGLELKVRNIDKAFEFPDTATECNAFIADKIAEIDELQITLTGLLENLEAQVQIAMNFLGAKKDQSDKDRLMNDLAAFLSTEANGLQLEGINWTNRLKYRTRELEKQSSLIHSLASSSMRTPAHDTDTDSCLSTRQQTENKVRLPSLEVPTFNGNYKDYPTFWTIFDSLIHSNTQLSDIDKFLFLRQALKGSAASMLGNIPVIEKNYDKAVKLLDKRYNKSGCIADLLITELEKLPRAREDASSCRKMLTDVTEKLTHIECAGVTLDNGRMWRRLILSKFPSSLSEKVLSKEQKEDTSFSTEEILEILENAVALKETIALTTDTFHERVTFSQNNRSNPNKDMQKRPQRFEQSTRHHTRHGTQARCLCGSPTHPISQCPTLRTPDVRRNEAVKRKVCWKCFDQNHRSSECKMLGPCPKCSKDHHSALCTADRFPPNSSTTPTTQPRFNDIKRPGRTKTSQNAEIICRPETEKKQYVLMTATALAFNSNTMDYETVTIFFDTGAQKSFITTEKSVDLQLPVIGTSDFTVSGFGGKAESFNSDEVSLTLKNSISGQAIKNIAIHTKTPLTSAMSTAKLSVSDRRFIRKEKIKVAQTTLEDKIVTPDILLGQDLIDNFILRDRCCITLPSGLILTPTVFGYAISGKSSFNGTDKSIHSNTILVATPVINNAKEEYKQDIKNLYELESLGIKVDKDSDEEAVLQFMEKYRSTISIGNGRITAGFPFLDNVSKLKNNFNVAVKRLQALMRLLQNDSEKMSLYSAALQDYSQQGIIEEVQEHEACGITTFYLPHRHVWTPGKTTQLRIVFDASSHAKGELSLNDVIHQGYSLTSCIFDILLKFRTYDNAMVADIQKAFLQIQLPKEHRDATRFLWMNDTSKPPVGSNIKYYRFCRVPFGINAGPAILNQALLKHLESFTNDTFREISDMLYVDNVILEGKTEQELFAKYLESKDVFGKVGMNLRDYLSNSPEVNNKIPTQDRAASNAIKVLGLHWHSNVDQLSLVCALKTQAKTTKRFVLSQINGLCFDPLGLLTPLLTNAKIFLQDLHKKKLGWDDQLSKEDCEVWSTIVKNMTNFSVTLPRRVTQQEGCKTRTLSMFVDSSKRVYACAAYITTETDEGQHYTRLYSAKSKVAPIGTTQTIPKLELLAIFIGMNMLEYIVTKSGLKFDKINLFSDSTIALAWIHSKKRLPSLVTTLTQKVQLTRERLGQYQHVHFHHVPTEENVADHATRGLSRTEAQDHIWFHGPQWLNRCEQQWPTRRIEYITQEEEEDCFAILSTMVAPFIPEIKKPRVWPTERICSYDKLKRIVAYSLRFIRRTSKDKFYPLAEDCETFDDIPNAQEMTVAERHLLQEEQRQSDLQSMMKSCKNRNVTNDAQGLTRKFGRLQNSELDYDTVNPIYLPRKGLLNTRIAEDLHKTLFHCGTNQLLNALRKRFWIPADRSLCKKTIRNCVTCQRHNAFPYKYPHMGPLPSERLTKAPPFSFTGVDLMGPVTVKNVSNEDEKRYVVLFTCLVTRMVHLEVAKDLSARNFLLAFKRFTSRRGVPLRMLSDNGTNFRLTETILRRNEPPLCSEFSLFLAKHNIQWNFIPPASPWMGGTWERMVGTVKRTLLKTIGRRKISEEIFYTVLCEIESAVNSRPLTVIGGNDDINDVLRPVDFIYKNIRHGVEIITQDDESQEDPPYQLSPELSTQRDAKTAISEAEKLTAKFWDKWKTEYLMELRDRHVLYGNNYKSANNLPKIGDIVLIDDDLKTSRDHWPMGLIQELITSRDGEIRSAILKTSSGREIQRPINRLIPLEIHASTSPSRATEISHEDEQLQRSETVQSPQRNEPFQELEQRPRFPRKVKRPVNYNENMAIPQPRLVISKAPIMLLALAACSLFTSAESTILKCTDTGFVLDAKSLDDNIKSEICINHMDCQAVYTSQLPLRGYLLPRQITSPYSVRWRGIINITQHEEEVKCPEQSVCNSIHCTFCPLVLGNPHCFPTITIAVVTTMLYVIALLTTACAYLGTSMVQLVKRRWKMYKARSSSTTTPTSVDDALEMQSYNTLDTNQRRTSDGQSTRSKLLFILSILATANCCQHTHVLNTKDVICDGYSKDAKCRNIEEHTFTMSSFKREMCMKIIYKDELIATMHLQLDSIRYDCIPVTHFFTRNTELRTISSKRCARAGSCTQHKCRTTGQNSYIPELNSSYHLPGIARCQESCGGIGCGCLLPMPGCLFSRTYPIPKDDHVYKVFSCPVWRKTARLRARLSFVTGREVTKEMDVSPEETVQLDRMNFTLDFITAPTIPTLDRRFVQVHNHSDPATMMSLPDDIFSVKCTSSVTAKNLTKCRIMDTCKCTSKTTTVLCRCASINITERMSSLDTRLPIRNSEFSLLADSGSITMLSHASVAEISIATVAQWKTATVIVPTTCEVQVTQAKGCYNCLQGAKAVFTCSSKINTILEVICSDHHYTIDCGPKGANTTIVINSIAANYAAQCSARCGSMQHDLLITGTLQYHSLWKDHADVSHTESANYVDLINIPDLSNIAQVFAQCWKTSLLAITLVAIAVIITIICGPMALKKLFA